MKPHAHAHAHTFKRANAYIHVPWQVGMESTWDLEKGREIKMERGSTDIKEMCLKLDTASFLPCTVTYAVCMCTSTLSGWTQHPLQSLCICSLHWRTQRASSPTRATTEEYREHRKDGKMGACLALSWGSQSGESRWAGLWVCFQSVDSDEILQNIRRVLRFW